MDSFHQPVGASHSVGAMNQSQPLFESQLAKRIRQIRRARGWSLAQFEQRSSGEIKAVVLGSYERGSRSISVRKLILIAKTFEVPVSFLLGAPNSTVALTSELMIDIRKVKRAEINPVIDFFTQIISNRGDWNGEILTLRNSDLGILALIHGSNIEELCQYLRTKRFLLEPNLKR